MGVDIAGGATREAPAQAELALPAPGPFPRYPAL